MQLKVVKNSQTFIATSTLKIKKKCLIAILRFASSITDRFVRIRNVSQFSSLILNRMLLHAVKG